MVGQKCYKSEKQNQIIELLQGYWEQLSLLNESLLSNQLDASSKKITHLESSLQKIQSFAKDNANELFITDIQIFLLKIQEQQQQICEFISHKLKKLQTQKPKRLIKEYYKY